MANPTDGMAVYESWRPSFNVQAQVRLAQIAAGGFPLVLNYAILKAHMGSPSDSNTNTIFSYLNYAQSVGLKVIFALNDPAIWYSNTISASYPELYADSGNQGTDSGFTTWVVNQVKTHPAIWGYYIGDELQQYSNSHAPMLAHAGYVSAADPTHPRIIINGSPNVASQTDIYFDCTDVFGDDFYPLGDTAQAWLTTENETAGVQTFCTAKSLQSAIVLQAFSWAQYYPPARARNWPFGAPWPTAVQMRTFRDVSIANMSPKVMLWYTYYDLLTADDPEQRWNALCWAANNQGTQPTEPSILALAYFHAYSAQSGWMSGWNHISGTLTPSINSSGIGQLTGSTDVNYFLLGSGSQLPATSAYVGRFSLSNSTTGQIGIVFNWVDSNNYMKAYVINGTTIRLSSIVGGVETILGSASFTFTSGNHYYLKVTDTGTSYTIKVYLDQNAIATTPLFTVSHGTVSTQNMQYGLYAQLGSSGDTASVYSFTAFNLNPPPSTPPAYYVATTGSDSNPGTSALPFATIQHAADLSSPGATIYVQPGTYSSGQITTGNPGTSTQRIQFIAQGTVNIRATGASFCWICSGNYIDIIGFDISGDGSLTCGVLFQGSYNTIQRCTIHDLVLVGSSTSNGIISSVLPASDNQIQACVIKNIVVSSQVHAVGITSQSARTTVQNCIFAQCGQIMLVEETGPSTISNNLAINCTNSILIWGKTDLVDNVTVSNNIIAFSSGSAIQEFGTTGTHNQYKNNLLWSAGSIALLNGNVATGTVAMNPLFTNYQNDGSGNYRLQSASPAINAGSNTGAPTGDATGAGRSLKAKIDIGPYLYIVTANFPAFLRRTGQFPTTKRRQS